MSAIGIVTAISNPALEAVVIRGLAESTDDVRVVRRCVEVSDVLAIAASGQARAVVIGDNLSGLDADIVSAITAHGVVAIALAEPGRSWPSAYFVPVVLDATSDPATLAGQIAAAARAGITDRLRPSSDGLVDAGDRHPAADEQRGKVIAVWGPAGAPGRSTIALGVADEVARLKHSTLLIDADPYGGSQAMMLGLLDESPGIAAACRAAAGGTLDVMSLARICLQVSPELRVLTGISRSDRWPELRPAAIEALVNQARALAAVTVIDCGFSIEEDEELTYDTLAPRRNAATTTGLQLADEVLLVVGCDPVSVARGVRAAQELRDLLPTIAPRVVVNKVRSSVLHGDPAAQLNEAFERYAGLRVDHLLPLDVKAGDAALLRGRMLAEAAPSSALRKGMTKLAQSLAPMPRSGPQSTARSTARSASRRERGKARR